MSNIQSVCVFCGSNDGYEADIGTMAEQMGKLIAQRGLRLVYGGGGIGLMGKVAQVALAEGAHVTGVITERLADTEQAPDNLSELIYTESLNDRKQIMFEKADAFIVLPGGVGTLDEVVDLMLWRQLGLQDKPMVLVDYDGFWQPFANMLMHMATTGFAEIFREKMILMVPTPEDVFDALDAADKPAVDPQPNLF